MTEPAIDLNRPPAPEPEPAPSSDLLELEAENQRLREANQKLSRAYKELEGIYLNEDLFSFSSLFTSRKRRHALNMN